MRDSGRVPAPGSSLIPLRYRKRPVVIEAMRYTIESRDAVIAWSGATGSAVDDDGAEYDLQHIRIPTLEGTMRADLGDWIIRGVAGEFYPCKPEIFEATYVFAGQRSDPDPVPVPPQSGYLLQRWTLQATMPGVIYADDGSGAGTAIGEFSDHLLAADAVCAHNAVLLMRDTSGA